MQRFSCFCAVVLLAGCAGTALADRYVAQAGQTPASPYTSWANAASNIQVAVDAAAVNDTIWVSNGTYTAASGANVVSITKGLRLYGASGNPRDVVIDGGGIPAVRRGVTVSLSAPAYVRLDALTISNGFSTGHAAGLYLSVQPATGTAIVHNCIVTHNFSSNNVGNSNRGGGVYVLGTAGSAFEVVLSECEILRNRTWAGSGAGLFLWGARILIDDCLIEGNSSKSGDTSAGFTSTACPDMICRNTIIQYNTNNGTWAGGVEVRGGNVFENTVIRFNNAFYGGGVFNRSTSVPPVVFRNCLITDNTGRGAQGGMDFWGSTGVLENCTIYNNIGSPDVYARSNNNSRTHARLTVVNTIVENFSVMAGSTVFATNSRANVITGWIGANNFTGNPQFVDEAARDYRLLKASPCFNTGTNLPWMAGTVDLDGLPRIDTTGPGIVDRGCYEYPYRGTVITVQ